MSMSVDLWLGKAADSLTCSTFFAESYDDDDGPISPFAESQGETFYDHDFLEVQFNEKFGSVDDALTGMSYSGSFADAVRAKVESFDFNLSVASFSEDFSNPVSVHTENLSLTYIGRFEYDLKASPVGNYDHLGHIYLHILGDVKLEFEGEMTDCIRVDAMGLMIGKVNPYARSLDISGVVPEVDTNQLRISVNAEGIWELRDFGNNGLSRLGLDSFDDERSMPWPGIKFSVGALEFEWSDGPK